MPPSDLAVVPWYLSESQYIAFRKSAVDQEDFFATYQLWCDAAMEHEHQADRQGIVITRICMDFEAFQAWCVATGHGNDCQGRSGFAEQRAASMFCLSSSKSATSMGETERPCSDDGTVGGVAADDGKSTCVRRYPNCR
jgi:hypothetical protein